MRDEKTGELVGMPAYGLGGAVAHRICKQGSRRVLCAVGESGEDMAALTSSLASLSITPLSSAAPSRSTAACTDGASLLRIECSSHAQKKSTAHHNKSRPKKHNPYDKNRRGPTVYERLPKPPPIWGFDTSDLDQAEGSATEASATAA